MIKKRLILLVVFLVFPVILFIGVNSVSNDSSAGLNRVSGIPEDFGMGDIFEGVITNNDLPLGVVVLGVGVYDRSCMPVPGGLTQCDGGILTEEYGVLNFNYTHNMHTEPCIGPNENFIVETVNNENKAIVKRISPSTH